MSPKWVPLCAEVLGHVAVFCRCRQRRWHCGERLPTPRSSRRNFAAQMMTSNRKVIETSINFYMSPCQSQFWIATTMMILIWFQTPEYIRTCQMASIQFASCCFMASQCRNTVEQSDNQFILPKRMPNRA